MSNKTPHKGEGLFVFDMTPSQAVQAIEKGEKHLICLSVGNYRFVVSLADVTIEQRKCGLGPYQSMTYTWVDYLQVDDTKDRFEDSLVIRLRYEATVECLNYEYGHQ